MGKEPDTIEGRFQVLDEKPKREPFFGPKKNVLIFFGIIAILYLSRLSAYWEHQASNHQVAPVAASQRQNQ